MAQMTLHFLNARKQLVGIEDWLSERLSHAFAVCAKILPLLDIDVVVKAGKRVIPEKGHLGYAPEKGLVYITIDPEHPSMRANPDQSLERMLAHELHHCARWDVPGYGTTLGEALVSEGLAGHFAQEVFGGVPEPWEKLPASTLRQYVLKAEGDWQNTEYLHAEWFFGSSEMPRWLGYSLGYQIVGQYLDTHRDERASKLAHAGAELFRRFLGTI